MSTLVMNVIAGPIRQESSTQNVEAVPACGVATANETAPAAARATKTLREYLDESGGKYSHDFVIYPSIRRHYQKIAAVIGDEALRQAVAAPSIPVSLEHLRGHDLETTVYVQLAVNYTYEEGLAVARAERSGRL